MRDLLAGLRGQPVDPLPFEEVRDRLRLRHLVDRGLQEVPLDRIVGSVGRAREFNRFFLPRREGSRGRWQQIEQLAEGPVGFPPVDLYQVGEAFFVVDGHHRVSVARALEAPADARRTGRLAEAGPVMQLGAHWRSSAQLDAVGEVVG